MSSVTHFSFWLREQWLCVWGFSLRPVLKDLPWAARGTVAVAEHEPVCMQGLPIWAASLIAVSWHQEHLCLSLSFTELQLKAFYLSDFGRAGREIWMKKLPDSRGWGSVKKEWHLLNFQWELWFTKVINLSMWHMVSCLLLFYLWTESFLLRRQGKQLRYRASQASSIRAKWFFNYFYSTLYRQAFSFKRGLFYNMSCQISAT